MSEFEGDIDDELLELAGATEKKRRKRDSTSSKHKRRKTDLDTESEGGQPESEEEEDNGPSEKNPYPLEGRYIDEADRERLMMMTELEREGIIAQRLEERQKIVDKQNLEQLLRAQNNSLADTDSVAKAAKRQHTGRGATKEKSKKLDELKAKRKAKDDKEQRRRDSPKRERSPSPMDMETSDEEEEDGQISKFEQYEERERRYADDEIPTLEDVEACRLTRETLVRFCLTGRFEELVRGAWVRFLIPAPNGQSVYRICEILGVVSHDDKPYIIDGNVLDKSLELRHGKACRIWKIDRVSNSRFTQEEYSDWKRHCEADSVKLPSKKSLSLKQAVIKRFESQPLTELELSEMLHRKNLLQPNKPSTTSLTMERSRLTQAKTLAERRQDYAEVERIEQELAKLTQGAIETARETNAADILAQVNERNRKANLEATRRAELENERRRKERKNMAKTMLAANGTDDLTTSRPGTPLKIVGGELPKGKTFGSSLAEAVDVDLGEF